MMRNCLALLAMIAIPAAPALAQTTPPTTQQATEAAKPKMVKKTICRRVDSEETTGSRVGSAPKVCKTVEVPAKDQKTQSDAQRVAPQGQANGLSD